MADSQWYVRVDDDMLGPLTQHELQELAKSGSVAMNTQVSRDGNTWIEARAIPWLTFADSVSPQAVSRPSQAAPGVPSSASSAIPIGWICAGIALGVVVLGLFGLVALAVIGALMADGAPGHYSSLPADAGIARLQFSWVDATEELIRMTQSLPPDELALLGLAALTTGSDYYAARIYLTNTGNVPIRVYPENVFIHFGDETAIVSTADDPRFLHHATLQPGQSTNGLVAFNARMDIGAVIRGGGGAMSYEDPTIEVVYR